MRTITLVAAMMGAVLLVILSVPALIESAIDVPSGGVGDFLALMPYWVALPALVLALVGMVLVVRN